MRPRGREAPRPVKLPWARASIAAALLLSGCAHAQVTNAGAPAALEAPAFAFGADGPTRPLRGRAVAPDGNPVARSEVLWILDMCAAAAPEHALRSSARAVTDDLGRFEIPAPRSSGYLSFWVRDDARWGLVSSYHWKVGDELHGDDLALLDRSYAGYLRVRDPAGAPIPRARVELVVGRIGAPLGGAPFARVADEDGEASFRGIEHENYWADVSAPGFARVRVQFPQPRLDEAPEWKEVTLEPSRTISGELRDEAGEPPTRATVRCRYTDAHGHRQAWHVTTLDGRFQFHVPRDRDATMEAWQSGELHGELAMRGRAVVPPSTSEVVVPLSFETE